MTEVTEAIDTLMRAASCLTTIYLRALLLRCHLWRRWRPRRVPTTSRWTLVRMQHLVLLQAIFPTMPSVHSTMRLHHSSPMTTTILLLHCRSALALPHIYQRTPMTPLASLIPMMPGPKDLVVVRSLVALGQSRRISETSLSALRASTDRMRVSRTFARKSGKMILTLNSVTVVLAGFAVLPARQPSPCAFSTTCITGRSTGSLRNVSVIRTRTLAHHPSSVTGSSKLKVAIFLRRSVPRIANQPSLPPLNPSSFMLLVLDSRSKVILAFAATLDDHALQVVVRHLDQSLRRRCLVWRTAN